MTFNQLRKDVIAIARIVYGEKYKIEMKALKKQTDRTSASYALKLYKEFRDYLRQCYKESQPPNTFKQFMKAKKEGK